MTLVLKSGHDNAIKRTDFKVLITTFVTLKSTILSLNKRSLLPIVILDTERRLKTCFQTRSNGF